MEKSSHYIPVMILYLVGSPVEGADASKIRRLRARCFSEVLFPLTIPGSVSDVDWKSSVGADAG